MRFEDLPVKFRSIKHGFSALILACCCLVSLFPAGGFAQEETETEPAQPEAAEPTSPEATEPATPEAAEAAEEIAPPKNSIFVTEPKSPDELMDAISLTFEIARLDATKIYLKQLLALKLDEQELSRLRRKHGPALYLQMANQKELHPESLQLLEQSNAAFAKQVGDPQQIQLRVKELQGDPDTREAAFTELRGIGVIALPGILQEFYKTEDPKLQEMLGKLLVGIGRPGVRPLIGALETDSTVLLLAVIRALEQIGDRRTAEHLWYFSAAPSQPAVIHAAAQRALQRLVPELGGSVLEATSPADQLRKLTRQYYRGEEVDRDFFEEEVTIWHWDAGVETIVPTTVSPSEASMLLALKFGKEALELAPQDEELQTVYLTGTLDRAIVDEEGVYQLPEGKGSVFEAGLKAGAEKISRVLEIALDDRRIRAAVAACRILAKNGSPRQLQMHSGRLPALVLALNDPNPRVQYEAAQAIVQINPSAKFPHSPRVVQILGRALVSEVKSSWNALIVDPSLDRGTGIMGMVRTLGAESQLATTGAAAFEDASSGAPPDFILLNVAVGRWGLTETLSNLRADVRTARIPVVLYGPARAEEVIENKLSDTILDEKLAMSDRLKALEDLHTRVRTTGGLMDKTRLRKLSDLTDQMIDKRQLYQNKSKETLLEMLQQELEAREGKKQIIGKERLIDEKRKMIKDFQAARQLDKEMEVGLKEMMADLVIKSVRTAGQHVKAETSTGPVDFRKKYQQELEQNSTLFYIEEPHSAEDLKSQLKPFEEKVRSAGMSPQERQRQARFAAITLAEIGTGKLSRVFPVEPAEANLLDASHDTDILYDVLTAMSVLPTAAVQNRLAEIIANDGVEVELRTRATGYLTAQVNQVTSKLKPEVVRRLTELEETATDEKFQTALTALLGSLKPDSSDLAQ